jgi:hypothetical protein
MAIVKKNPNLPDYFLEVRGVTLEAPPSAVPSIVGMYEDAKVMWFPELKPRIDTDFWASLDTRSLPALKKLSTLSNIDGSQDHATTTAQIERLEKAGVERGLAAEVARQMASLLEQVMPLYQPLFGGYRFTRGKVVWRLQDIYTENLHLDAYGSANPDHFARIFINLDTQPRIWHTSWQAEDVMRIAKGRLPPQEFTRLSANDLWSALNFAVFGKTARDWWDDQPRHVAFFEPGDVWSVDSRLVAHQIFYGRRAVSIDFSVDAATMLSGDRHYLRLAESARASVLASPTGSAV